MSRLALISFLLFYFLVALDDSWASCTYTEQLNSFGSYSTSQTCNNNTAAWCGITCTDLCASITVPSYVRNGINIYTNCFASPNQYDCAYSGGTSNCNRVDYNHECLGRYRCSTSLEADSVVCELDGKLWQNGTCSDACQGKIGYGCITLPGGLNGGYTHQVYKLDSCTMTQELLEESPGSCAEIGYCNYGENKCTGSTLGGYGGSSSSPGDSINWSSSSAYNCKNFGMIGNTCFYECDNGAYGECEARDGICDMHAVGANCSWEIPPTSSSSPGGGASSGGTPGSSSSPGDSTGGTSSGIDYTGKLNEIIDSIHNTNDAQRNTQVATMAVNQSVKNLHTTTQNISTKISQVNTNLQSIQSASCSAAAAGASAADSIAD